MAKVEEFTYHQTRYSPRRHRQHRRQLASLFLGGISTLPFFTFNGDDILTGSS